ncbi:hypothetical protein F441_02439 [Phytophthora nicotianae CJ01A1]|uniref:Uncharacterized protein n=2 Tax=Phytophthora nicotianae TaxID=4792 RepID=W2QPT9_PHYN3|nr:hypothetical protein PPTG_22081 [Phytophthora nicotianae INRA-310]ETN15128.1 hypothetical protein PPTG_22081 [Phytophthora nicotianae INRA-310]ETP24596.1 hypothetical protein F441_02439 [Phytophthora nicotianae CJ01A1]
MPIANALLLLVGTWYVPLQQAANDVSKSLSVHQALNRHRGHIEPTQRCCGGTESSTTVGGAVVFLNVAAFVGIVGFVAGNAFGVALHPKRGKSKMCLSH